MAIQHGVPGEWARVRGTVFSLWPLFLAFTFLGAFITATICGKYLPVFGALLLVSLVSVAVCWRNGVRRVASFFVGARGEERVASLLSALPETYHVFHDFVADGAHVDHVVVGPAGVFSIETKNWQGKVTIDDGLILVDSHVPDRSPLKQTIREADAVGRSLAKLGWNGTVTPVLCFASDTFIENSRQVGGAFVVNASELAFWLNARGTQLPPGELSRLVTLMVTRS